MRERDTGTDVPEFQLPLHHFEKTIQLRPVGRPIRRTLQGCKDREILVLRDEEIGAVDREEYLPASDRPPDKVDAETLNVSAEFDMDMGEAPLVRAHDPDRPGFPDQFARPQ